MTEDEFKCRTKEVALRIIRLTSALPRSTTAAILAKQLLRSGTSIGANYRAACRGKSPADVVHKLSIVEEEADESLYWIELMVDANLVAANLVEALLDEINQILSMTVASIKTLRRRTANLRKSKIQNPKSKIQ